MVRFRQSYIFSDSGKVLEQPAELNGEDRGEPTFPKLKSYMFG